MYCLVCRQDFKPYRSWQKFCSRTCTQKMVHWRNKKTDKAYKVRVIKHQNKPFIPLIFNETQKVNFMKFLQEVIMSVEMQKAGKNINHRSLRGYSPNKKLQELGRKFV